MKIALARLRQAMWVVILTALIAAITWQVRATTELAKQKDFRAAVRQLQAKLESFAEDNDGLYPSDLAKFVEQGKVELPKNPYAAGRVRILKPGEPRVPGGLVYIGYGLIVKEGATAEDFEKSKTLVPKDTVGYMLLVYGPKVKKREDFNARSLRRMLSDSAIGCGSYPSPVIQPLSDGHWPEQIEYSRVDIITSEFDYYMGNQ
jgi:hypothetical protein